MIKRIAAIPLAMGLLVLLSVLSGCEDHVDVVVAYLGTGALYMYLLIIYFNLLMGVSSGIKIARRLHLFWGFVPLAILYVFQVFNEGFVPESVSRMIQFVTILFILLVGIQLSSKFDDYDALFYVMGCVGFAFLVVVGVYAVVRGSTVLSLGLKNPNSLGLYSLNIFFWAYARSIAGIRGKGRDVWIPFVLATMCLYYSGSRASMIALAFGVIALHNKEYLLANKKRYLLISLVITIIPALVVWAASGDLFYWFKNFYDSYASGVYHKKFESGRDRIWPILIAAISEKPILGWGLHVNLRNISSYDLSAHNMYLQILFQSGLLGVLLFFVFLYRLYVLMWRYRENEYVRVSYVFMLVLMVTQAFEVALTQNNLPITISFWTFVAFSIASAISDERRLVNDDRVCDYGMVDYACGQDH